MAHLLISRDGGRFQLMHGFSNLLVSQLEVFLEGKPTDVRLRSNVLGKEKVLWPDSSRDDYIYRRRHPSFEKLCTY